MAGQRTAEPKAQQKAQGLQADALQVWQEDVRNVARETKHIYEHMQASKLRQQDLQKQEQQLLLQLKHCQESLQKEQKKQTTLTAQQHTNDKYLEYLENDAEDLLRTLNSAKKQRRSL